MRTWTTDLTLNFTLHGFHCLTGVKARGWQGGPDNKTQAKYSVSRTRKKDAVWEEPAAWRSWAIPMVRWMMAGNVMIYFSEFICLTRHYMPPYFGSSVNWHSPYLYGLLFWILKILQLLPTWFLESENYHIWTREWIWGANEHTCCSIALNPDWWAPWKRIVNHKVALP